MTQIKKLIGVGAIVVLSIAVSCKKDNNKTNNGDTTPPTITLTNPIIHQHYNTNDTIKFTGMITDNSKVSKVEVFMFTEDDTTRFFDQMYQPDASSFDIDTYYVVTTTDSLLEYHFQVKAVDDSGNKSETDPENHVHINTP